MEDQFNKIQGIFYKLHLAGNPLSMDDMVTQTLAGLDYEYNQIVVQLADKAQFTWIDLQTALLSYNSQLE